MKKRRAPHSNSLNVKNHLSFDSNIHHSSVTNKTQRLWPSTTTSSPTVDEPTSEPNYLGLVEDTSRSHKEAFVDITTTKPSHLSTVIDSDMSTPLEISLDFRNEEDLGDVVQAAQVKTCEDLLKAGFLDNKVYTVDIPQDARDSNNNNVGHDFRHRLCDQQTSGGGWTVTISPHFFIGLFVMYFVLL